MTELLKQRILILDGAMGTMIQRWELSEDDYRGARFSSYTRNLKGNNECLNLTCPHIIASIHEKYIEAGADIICTNTFSANSISQEEYGCADHAAEMALHGAAIARETADKANKARDDKDRILVAGSIGPTSKSLSLAQDMNAPAYREYSFEMMEEAYLSQAEALIKGGVDLLLIETCFDALNTKAALSAIRKTGTEIPVMISVSVSDRSGRTLTGQTLEAFYTSVCHYPIMAFGLNCSLGCEELAPLVREIAGWCGCAVSCYPNAGLPDGMGAYDQGPAEMAGHIRKMAADGLINITGGCCGTTPEHIKAIADAVKDISPRTIPSIENRLTVSGLESYTIDKLKNNFTNIGERTNVAGSRKFARLIASGDYDAALAVAASQIEDGASIIDINMDDAMLDSTQQMETFLRHISTDPATAKAAVMIDSSHWDTILAGLRNTQGKCIVNSISLKEGEEAFIRKAETIRNFGAAVVVMAFDEQGQATDYKRKIEICGRAYQLLTEKAGYRPEDIIFDVNILSIGTGIPEHTDYAVDFINAVAWIKKNLPGTLTSGGVSNLSFAFRGNSPVREAMHSAFLYHAIKAGLDMAIVNPTMLQVYESIEPELLKCVEDVIFNTDAQATERLIEKAGTLVGNISGQAGDKPDLARMSANHTSPHDAATIASPTARLMDSLVKGSTVTLRDDIADALSELGTASSLIEGPLMEGMEHVGKLFAEGKMFLPQVVKSAKVMRDAVNILEPLLKSESTDPETESGQVRRPRIVIATVKGDVHDIGKNITATVLTCNGFHVYDLGVMVDNTTILEKAEEVEADIIAVSGLITPSLYQMEELCREMSARGMNTPLFVGGATTSALHTAVKLAPLYNHVFHSSDASSAAVHAKRCISDRNSFEKEQMARQEELRQLHSCQRETKQDKTEGQDAVFRDESYPTACPSDLAGFELPLQEAIKYFDWKMFYAIWGVKNTGEVLQPIELTQLRRDAEDELELGNFRIMISARFLQGASDMDDICFEAEGKMHKIPMFRQEEGKKASLSDFVIPAGSGRTSPFGMFAISVCQAHHTHEQGCCCPSCTDQYADLIAKTVRMTLAEAASAWLSEEIMKEIGADQKAIKVIKPAAGYSSCPDHSLKKDIIELLPDSDKLGIELTESCAMIPESSICGLIFMHPEAFYPEIRSISKECYSDYAERRGMDPQTARRFLGHLRK